jgi:hypothetical protein
MQRYASRGWARRMQRRPQPRLSAGVATRHARRQKPRFLPPEPKAQRRKKRHGWRFFPIKEESRPVSRVLSRTIIPLGLVSPRASSGLPGSACGSRCEHLTPCGVKPHGFPIWPCSRWGLPCRRVLPPARCALTAPFHPYRRPGVTRNAWAVCSLLHFPWARAPQALPGTSSAGARTFLPPRANAKAAIARPTPRAHLKAAAGKSNRKRNSEPEKRSAQRRRQQKCATGHC